MIRPIWINFTCGAKGMSMTKLRILLATIRERQSVLAQMANHGNDRQGDHEGCVDANSVASIAEEIAEAIRVFEAPEHHEPIGIVVKTDRWSHLPPETATARRRQSRKQKRKHQRSITGETATATA